MKIDHIGIAVESLADAVKVYEQALGLEVAGYDEVEGFGVRVAMLNIGESYLELLEPTEPDSPVAKFMAKRGQGLHHVAVRVENIAEAVERLKASGIRLIDPNPRPGAHNTRVVFIHPSSTNGVLLELVEHGE
jgi:methylmalonyl-CoA epimerase